MKQKKILLFSRDPGAANTIISLINPLIKSNYEVKLFGKEFALKQYLKFGFLGLDITEYLDSVSKKDISIFLKKEKPDFIITGTSGEDFTEKYIWSAAQELNIPTLAILDQWINYGVRFSDLSTLDLGKKNIKASYLPTFVSAMDQQAKNELIEFGIDQHKIIISGHPYFDFLGEQKINISQEELDKIRAVLGIEKTDFVITFASEPILRDYGNVDYWGFTERTIFEIFFNALKKLLEFYPHEIKVIIKVHPREDLNYYSEFIKGAKLERVSFVVDQKVDSLKTILISDVICGISSMFLLESAVLEKPILSIHVGLKRENPFILAKKGLVKSVYSSEMLVEKLKDFVINKNFPQYKFEFVKDSVSKIINHVERCLC